jgi:ectoine hydroxylase
VAPTGPPGSVLIVHGRLAPASPGNNSPYDRTICYVTFCSVENHITRFKRPEWIAHRDFTPIAPLADDCLAELLAREHAAE